MAEEEITKSRCIEVLLQEENKNTEHSTSNLYPIQRLDSQSSLDN